MRKLSVLLAWISVIRFLILVKKQKKSKIPKVFAYICALAVAALFYLMPINDGVNFYGKKLYKIPFLRFLLLSRAREAFSFKTKKILIDSQNLLSIRIANPYINQILFFVLTYTCVVKHGKFLHIPYFIRYNAMHAMLISLLQIPFFSFYKGIESIVVLNPLLRNLLSILKTSIILSNFGFIIYAMFRALFGYFIQIPIITDSALIHVAKE